jgi:glycosyltransferase involved in cell wall biosynthesis
MNDRIAVVVPAFNEERLIETTLRGIPDFVSHIVVVDDASSDETFVIAKRAGSHDARIDIVRLGFNQGVGRAISTGYERARSLGAKIVCVMAADNQMNPDDLPALLEPILRGDAGYVKGNRLAHAKRAQMPPVRRVGTQVLARATKWIGRLDTLEDSQCGYTAISVDALEKLDLADVFPRYGYPNQLLIDIARAGITIAEIPVEPVYGDEISGFVPQQVVLPITGILFRALLR